MPIRQLFARKSIETLLAEMKGENRLRRVLGPIALTSLGVGAIIGAGIFVMTGEEAATKAGPSVMLSFVVAGLGCLFAALCYAEFASMAPVAGSAYTYAYATLGELFAWIIGWDLILEYAMSCGVVAADWTKYFNELLQVLFDGWQIPARLSSDPFTIVDKATQVTGILNLPAVVVMGLVTAVLVIGIRESALTNALLVITKVGVVIFVIAVGWHYISLANWTSVPAGERRITDVEDLFRRRPEIAQLVPVDQRGTIEDGEDLLRRYPEVAKVVSPAELSDIKALPSVEQKWGVLSLLGVHHWLERVDDRYRSPFMPYGPSGILVGAAAVFFAYLGFDSISTHAEEARRPQRDVPIGILASLVVCTLLYLGVSAVITGMEPYPEIDQNAAVAAAFRRLAEREHSLPLRISAGLIAIGAVAGMTSVLLITLLSQARIFLAMARDRLLPPSIFGAVHPRFRTPHLSTMFTGLLLCVITAFTPINLLFNMVNIGTLLAFIIVCAAVLLLRLRRPDARRPFRCPLVYLVAPLGIAVNMLMMLFLPLDTWIRLFGWLALGLVIYAGYGFRHTALAEKIWASLQGKPVGDGDYYRSESYRRRLRFSLSSCLALLLLMSLASVWLIYLWQGSALVVPLQLCSPLILILFALLITAFLAFMTAVNYIEWRKVAA